MLFENRIRARWAKKNFSFLATAVCLYAEQRRPKRKWVKQWLLNIRQHTHLNLLQELRLEPSDWRNYLRLDEEAYFQLLRLVTPMIKKYTVMRQCITPHERLAATLRFLATGMNFEELKFVTAISPQRLGVIIPETCLALLKSLRAYMMGSSIISPKFVVIACSEFK
ncbi:hypothetical protein JTE90_028604 [Oedothorax gibbosus]|uniref:Uncharacterized protein n=1 Tax=Oedothorax gibbosus TaxID=931172 RepID=A0AAV6TWY5_9ARAC|nr:hypothetical protein JTE90_028604 [Oedothorax gibbosus]